MDFALTEAAYTVVRILQHCPTIEKADDEPYERTGQEQQTMTMVLAIANGCRIHFTT